MPISTLSSCVRFEETNSFILHQCSCGTRVRKNCEKYRVAYATL